MKLDHIRKITIFAVGCATSPALAELRVGSEPPLGQERSATVGSPVVERFRYEVKRVAIPKDEVSQRVLWAKLRISAGAELQIDPNTSVKLKACGDQACALDDDGDSIFDRIAMDSVSQAFKLDRPVQYKIADVSDLKAGNFRQVITYTGTGPDTLRLSYREFADDMARPAFTEDLSLPLGKTFPQQIAFKDVKMTILSIDGMGMRYRIEK